MLKLLIASCFVILAFGATIPDVKLDTSGRVLDGSDARLGQFRYMVSLRLREANPVHFCGGTLFHARWVVSAAHCTSRRTAAVVLAVVGTINRTSGGTAYGVSRIINHPSFNSPSAFIYTNDISLLQTSTAVLTTASVAPASLSSSYVGAGFATISGWGITSHPGTSPEILRWTTLTVISNTECKSRHSNANAAIVLDSTICTFDRPGHGACAGDSGSPLAQGNTVIGAVSWGIPCAQGFPDAFARISSFRGWIESVSGL